MTRGEQHVRGSKVRSGKERIALDDRELGPERILVLTGAGIMLLQLVKRIDVGEITLV